MSTWLRYFAFWRRDPRVDARDEIGFHLEMRVKDLVARGLSPAEARKRAEREFGDPAAVQGQLERIDSRLMRREAQTEWWGELRRDVRVGLRSLRNSPGFTVTSVLCAALGIGVTAAIVSTAHSILVRPLPYRDADQLVSIYGEHTERGWKRSNISFPDYKDWREQARSFDGIGIWTWSTATLFDEGAEAERVDGARVAANLFDILGVRPQLGRLFLSGEDAVGAPRIALISDRLWRRRFGADSSIVGKNISIDGVSVMVVGVMQPGFNFPERGDLWRPFIGDPATEIRDNRGYAGAIGRMKRGVSVEQARADLHRVDADLARQFPGNKGWRADVWTMRDDLVGDLRQPLKVFLWSVGLVLLMVCANIANLLLARGATRSREMAVRSALGASRRRLGRQLMTESLLVAGLGAALGVGVAWWAVRLLRFAFPEATPPFFIHLSLDGFTLAVILGVAVLTGVLFGAFPAIRGTRVDLNTALRDGTRGGGDSLRRSRVRGALVIGEVALSVMLMIGALLLVRSYQNLIGTDLGFDEKPILSARITLPTADYPTRAHSLAFYDRLFDRLRTVGGVKQVGSAQGIPFSGWNVQAGVQVEGQPAPEQGKETIIHYQVVSPDYFKTIGVQLKAGRWLTPADRDTTAPAMLVNETFVKRVLGDVDPIGKRISVAGDSYGTIVGVIRDFRHYRLPEETPPAVYYSQSTWTTRSQALVIRTATDDAAALVPALRNAVREIDPRIAVYDVRTFEEAISRSLWRQRLQGNVLGIFAALALVLACVGLYGVISYAVAQRTRELGVRIALGARRSTVLMLVFGQSGRLVFAGVVVGLIGALYGVRVLESLLYGVKATDPMTFALVPGLLAAVALLAAVIPARRATRVDPIIAMRAD